jgi:hypothetical protein
MAAVKGMKYGSVIEAAVAATGTTRFHSDHGMNR